MRQHMLSEILHLNLRLGFQRNLSYISKKGNIRDEANLNQLLVLANMECYNAVLIEQGKTMSDRLILLRKLAVKQMESLSLVNMRGIKQLSKRKEFIEEVDR